VSSYDNACIVGCQDRSLPYSLTWMVPLNLDSNWRPDWDQRLDCVAAVSWLEGYE
jgi:hypothetical protein